MDMTQASFEKEAKNYVPTGEREAKGVTSRGLLDEYYTPNVADR